MSTIEPAAIYARYSYRRQGEKSIDEQLSEARLEAGRLGLAIVKEYVDRAQTGTNDDRDGFQQMLRDSGRGGWSHLIVWKTDRIGRNKEELAINKYTLKRNGVHIHYVAESIPDTPEGIILESVMEGMAAYYSKQLSQNVRRGQRHNAERGLSIGGNIALGYKVDQDRHYVINEKTAPLVRLIFAQYAAGKTPTQITDELNRQGFRTARGALFNKNSLHSVLRNEKYIGVYTFKDEIRIENAIPRLIDDATWEKVQQMFKQNKKAPAHKWTKADYLLTGKLFCGSCGSPMVGECGTGKSGARYDYYLCTAHKQRKGCRKRAVPKAGIEELVLGQAKELIFDDETMLFLADRIWEQYQKDQQSDDFDKQLQNQLMSNKKAMDNLVRAMEAGIFNSSTKSRMDELDEQRVQIEAEIAAQALKKEMNLTRDKLLLFLLQFRKLDFSDPACQKQIIETFINSVYVYDDKTVITFNYTGDNNKITLSDVDKIQLEGVRTPLAMAHQVQRVFPGLGKTLFCCALALIQIIHGTVFGEAGRQFSPAPRCAPCPRTNPTPRRRPSKRPAPSVH